MKKIISALCVVALLGGAVGVVLADSQESISNSLGISGVSLSIVDGAIDWGFLNAGGWQTTAVGGLDDNQTIFNDSVGIANINLSAIATDMVDGPLVLSINSDATIDADEYGLQSTHLPSGSPVWIKDSAFGYVPITVSPLGLGVNETFQFDMTIGPSVSFVSDSLTGSIIIMASAI